MRKQTKPTCLLDANVLYPAPVRDYLLWLALVELYQPKWTNEIQEEWIRNLLLKRIDLKRRSLRNVQKAMDSAFPDANVEMYQGLIQGLELPDANDRHVLAAAIKCNADVIATFNVKDFPAAILKVHGIEAQNPDVFILSIIGTNKSKAKEALTRMVNGLNNPPKSAEDVLVTLEKCGLSNTVKFLRSAIGSEH